MKDPNTTNDIKDTKFPTQPEAGQYVIKHVPWDDVFTELCRVNSDMYSGATIRTTLSNTLFKHRNAYKKNQDDQNIFKFYKYFMDVDKQVSAHCSYSQMTAAFGTIYTV